MAGSGADTICVEFGVGPDRARFRLCSYDLGDVSEPALLLERSLAGWRRLSVYYSAGTAPGGVTPILAGAS